MFHFQYNHVKFRLVGPNSIFLSILFMTRKSRFTRTNTITVGLLAVVPAAYCCPLPRVLYTFGRISFDSTAQWHVNIRPPVVYSENPVESRNNSENVPAYINTRAHVYIRHTVDYCGIGEGNLASRYLCLRGLHGDKWKKTTDVMCFFTFELRSVRRNVKPVRCTFPCQTDFFFLIGVAGFCCIVFV